MAGLPHGIKFEDMFTHFDTIHGQTLHESRWQAALCIASRGQKL